jgi:hypothetical protein
VFDSYLICHSTRVPDPVELANALSGMGVTFPDLFDARTQVDRFVPCSFEGLLSGFDFANEQYDPGLFELTGDEAVRIGDRDTVLRFSTYSNAQEIAGAAVVSSVLARLTGGALITEFEEDILWGIDAIAWLSEFLPPTREQFNGPCKFRSFASDDVPLVRIRIDPEGGV